MIKKSNIINKQTAHTWLQRTSVVIVAITIFWLIAINRSPNILRPLSMALRGGYTIIVPSIFIVLYIAYRIRGRIGNFLASTLTLSIFAFALAGGWALGVTESGLFSGVIPMLDSSGYYTGSLSLLVGQSMNDFASNKPLFSPIFAVLLWVAGQNLLIALIFLVLLVALGCYVLTVEIQKTHGTAAAVFTLVVIFTYYRYHVGVVRTENLGILFSVIGLGLIWSSIKRKLLLPYLGGLFALSLAMIARPGPMFILPAISLWGGAHFIEKNRKISWKILFSSGAVILFAFFVNNLFFQMFGMQSSVQFGRFPYAFYGLASGGNHWAYAQSLYPDASEIEIYNLALALIIKDPLLILKGIIYNYATFFSDSVYGVFSFMGYSFMSMEKDIYATISYWTLLSFSIMGIYSWLKNRGDSFLRFTVAASIGLLASVPFLPPTDAFRMRLYASGIPVIAILSAFGFKEILTLFRLDWTLGFVKNELSPLPVASYYFFVLFLCLVAPFFVFGVITPPALHNSNCSPEKNSVLVYYSPDSMVNTLPQDMQFLDWAPNFHIIYFHRKAHDFPDLAFMNWVHNNVKANKTMFYALDLKTNDKVLLVTESNLLPSPPIYLEICGKWDDTLEISDYDVMIATHVFSIE